MVLTAECAILQEKGQLTRYSQSAMEAVTTTAMFQASLRRCEGVYLVTLDLPDFIYVQGHKRTETG